MPLCIRPYRPSDHEQVILVIHQALAVEALNVAAWHCLLDPQWAVCQLFLRTHLLWFIPDRLLNVLTMLFRVAEFVWLSRSCSRSLIQHTFKMMSWRERMGPDMSDIRSYYSASPGSGFWILESVDGIKRDFAGFIAIDATSTYRATIRHFHVKYPYRRQYGQDALLLHTLRHLRGSQRQVKRVDIQHCRVLTYIAECLTRCGFQAEHLGGSMGCFVWDDDRRFLSLEARRRMLLFPPILLLFVLPGSQNRLAYEQ